MYAKNNKKWVEIIRMVPIHNEGKIRAMLKEYAGYELHLKLSEYFFKINKKWVAPEIEWMYNVNDQDWGKIIKGENNVF